MLKEDAVRKKLKLLQPFIGEQAENIWLAYNASNPIDRRAWETKIDTMSARYLRTFTEEAPLEPIPKEHCKGAILLGHVTYLNMPLYPFHLEKEYLLKHTGVFSQTGSGKTNLAMLIARQLLEQEIPYSLRHQEKLPGTEGAKRARRSTRNLHSRKGSEAIPNRPPEMGGGDVGANAH